MTGKHSTHSIDVLFVITLFFCFALSVIVLTQTGASVYGNIVDDMTQNFESRTAYTYIFNKIHQADADNSVSVGSYCGVDAIILSEEIDNLTYCTYLYCYNGYLMELFTRYGQEIDPEYGTELMEISDFSVEQISDSLYRFTIDDKGGTKDLYIHTHAGKMSVE